MPIKLFIIFYLFLLNLSLYAQECGHGVIKYNNEGKEVVENLELCIKEEKRGILVTSVNCKGGVCKELKEPHKRPINLSKYPSAIGSPGFKVCRELGGSPQIIEFQFPEKYKNEWKQTSRCIFRENTFASNNYLMKLWKSYIVD